MWDETLGIQTSPRILSRTKLSSHKYARKLRDDMTVHGDRTTSRCVHPADEIARVLMEHYPTYVRITGTTSFPVLALSLAASMIASTCAACVADTGTSSSFPLSTAFANSS